MEIIIPSFEKSLFDPTIVDTVAGLVEVGIDTMLTNGVLQEIPIAKTIIGIGKFAQNVADRNLLKQTLTFIKKFNSQSIDAEKLENYREILKSNPQRAEDELGRVMIILNRTVDNTKSKMLAQFFRAYINSTIDWEKFCELSEITERLFVGDLDLIYSLFSGKEILYGDCGYFANRLIAIGLMLNPSSEIKSGDLIKPDSQLPVNLSKLGKTFCHCCRL